MCRDRHRNRGLRLSTMDTFAPVEMGPAACAIVHPLRRMSRRSTGASLERQENETFVPRGWRHMDLPSSAFHRAPARPADPARAAVACRSIARAGWIKGPAWDLVWILNPLWLAPLFLLLERAYGDGRNSPVDWLFFALAVPLWFGHRVSSAWLAYTTPAYRPLLTSQRLRFVACPVAVALACFAVLLAPDSVLPIPLEQRVVCLAVVDYLWVSHHFA